MDELGKKKEVSIIEEKEKKVPIIEEKGKGVEEKEEEMVTKTKRKEVANFDLKEKGVEKQKKKEGEKLPKTKISKVEEKCIANLGPRGKRKLPASSRIGNPLGGIYLRKDCSEASLASGRKELTSHYSNYYKLAVADENKHREVSEGCINPFNILLLQVVAVQAGVGVMMKEELEEKVAEKKKEVPIAAG